MSRLLRRGVRRRVRLSSLHPVSRRLHVPPALPARYAVEPVALPLRLPHRGPRRLRQPLPGGGRARGAGGGGGGGGGGEAAPTAAHGVQLGRGGGARASDNWGLRASGAARTGDKRGVSAADASGP